MAMLELRDLGRTHDAALGEWYGREPHGVPPAGDLRSLILAQHYCNFMLWGLEDEARRTDVADSVIAGIKRSIDGWNQARNDLIERIDEEILDRVPVADAADAEQHSETPGQMIDRMSILALKIWHMGGNVSRADDPALAVECAGKLEVLREQRQDLQDCLERLLVACAEGRRFFKLYRQFKSYNDPRLNPALAKRGGA